MKNIKVVLKSIFLFILIGIFSFTVCAADSLTESGHILLMVCGLFTPMLLCWIGHRTFGYADVLDVLDEKVE